jgi:hypothetical protein
MSGAIPPLLHMLSWRAQGKLYTLLDVGIYSFVVILGGGGVVYIENST